MDGPAGQVLVGVLVARRRRRRHRGGLRGRALRGPLAPAAADPLEHLVGDRAGGHGVHAPDERVEQRALHERGELVAILRHLVQAGGAQRLGERLARAGVLERLAHQRLGPSACSLSIHASRRRIRAARARHQEPRRAPRWRPRRRPATSAG
ncbi:MAG: hypothetical protein M5U28_44670 [Sandaracinaceae bacterium]|nr:hypothetical protein [Sandaracinaceae bacterium]